MKVKSIAEKNVLILILSLIPFIAALGYSVYQSSDREYLSAAINLAGSQRMRTMFISNYSQQLNDSEPSDSGDLHEAVKNTPTLKCIKLEIQ